MFGLSGKWWSRSPPALSDRCWKLVELGYGRDCGWYVEYEGQVVGNLDDCQWVEMFWDSYRVTAESELTAAIIYDDGDWGPWGQAKFRYRNKQLNEYAEFGFCGGGAPFIKDGRIQMRTLYLLPGSEAEDKAVRKEIARREQAAKTSLPTHCSASAKAPHSILKLLNWWHW